jgi:proteasome alpha subunit
MMVVTADDAATHETFSTNAPPVPPSVPEPGTPPGLGDPANPDTAGGREEKSED